ncbi:alkaline phosphatase family protein [Halorubrum ezzemoulense]|uniref:alkaline phosphatase family protein n=1 Tax=Halorubrum ezzemoulense TaxID=337243 RepID=UPI00232C1B72|nr:alkaline phosphatase family protein [Halorubrum ezzemoulense]MDB2262051.1 alkaline phosphatase family protein [Halorubrum ezzemoulense]MDB2268898.1 alkaline phosphatase family protein [Halorubrum ezzemoulense]
MGLFDKLGGDSSGRVVFLGIDGVPYELIDEHPKVFPNLTEIAESGSGGQMSSIVPPESSACWPALTTGTNPGKTGVYGFQDRDPGSYETYVPMGSHVSAPRVWDMVTEEGRDASVFNVPVTFPPSTRIQRHVSGFLSPSIEKATGDGDVQQVVEGFGYQIDVNAKLGHDNDKSEFIRDAEKTISARHKTFRHYLQKDDWDLFFGVYMTTDRVNHFLFGDYATDGEYADEFLDFYQTLDAYIGEVRQLIDSETTLIVASDHGFTHLTHEVYLNKWLEEEGWLEYATEDHDELGDINSTTRAYSLIPGRVFLNLAGREPDGAVPDAEYESVRDDLIADLEELTGPDGRNVCRRIVRGEDAFSGGDTEIAPDLVIIPADGYDLKAGFTDKDEVFGTGPRNGMHKFENACLFSTDPDLALTDVDLLDIVPTILELMNVDVDGERLDGTSLVA